MTVCTGLANGQPLSGGAVGLFMEKAEEGGGKISVNMG